MIHEYKSLTEILEGKADYINDILKQMNDLIKSGNLAMILGSYQNGQLIEDSYVSRLYKIIPLAKKLESAIKNLESGSLSDLDKYVVLHNLANHLTMSQVSENLEKFFQALNAPYRKAEEKNNAST